MTSRPGYNAFALARWNAPQSRSPIASFVSWPERIKRGGAVRSQCAHLVDIVPTILEETGIPAPWQVDEVDQVPMSGTSLIYTFDEADAPERHTTQYFEMIANQGFYHEGWMANTAPTRFPWVSQGESSEDPFEE